MIIHLTTEGFLPLASLSSDKPTEYRALIFKTEFNSRHISLGLNNSPWVVTSWSLLSTEISQSLWLPLKFCQSSITLGETLSSLASPQWAYTFYWDSVPSLCELEMPQGKGQVDFRALLVMFLFFSGNHSSSNPVCISCLQRDVLYILFLIL